MHVILVMVGGLVLLGEFQLFARLWAGPGHEARTALIFVPLWLVVTLVNMWIGVARAGYSVREELPIGLLVAAVPIACAILIAWRLGR